MTFTQKAHTQATISDAEAIADGKFYVATDLEYYWPDATQKDVVEYATFAAERTGCAVEFVERYHQFDLQRNLRQRLYAEFVNQ